MMPGGSAEIRTLRKAAAGLLLLIALSGCGGASSGHATATSSATSKARAAPLPQPSVRCGAPHRPAVTLRFPASDGFPLEGAIVGHGAVGVVLLHEYPGPMCGWWPYANFLAARGLEALLFDFRCLGLSTCRTGWRADPVADVAGAVHVLRARGVRKIVLVGASLGGVASVMAGARLGPAAVVDLSGERELSDLLPGVRLDSYAAAPGLRAPALFVVARGDPNVSVPEMRSVYRRTGSHIKRFTVLPAGAGHGWDMLLASGAGWSPLAHQIVAFVRAYARARR
jgi:hypothetical protein